MDRRDEYLTKRIKKLLAEGWDDRRIVQQLEAFNGAKKIQRLIEKVSAENR